MTVHFVPWVFDGGFGSAIMFAIAIPISWASVRVAAIIVKPAAGEQLPMIAWGLVAATLLDGLGVTFIPGLYAGIGAASQFGLAWIIWGVGLFLIFAMRGDRA